VLRTEISRVAFKVLRVYVVVFCQNLSQMAMELFPFSPHLARAGALDNRRQSESSFAPCVCFVTTLAGARSLHLATQLNIGWLAGLPRGLFTKIHFDLWLLGCIVCC